MCICCRDNEPCFNDDCLLKGKSYVDPEVRTTRMKFMADMYVAYVTCTRGVPDGITKYVSNALEHFDKEFPGGK